MSGFGNMGRIFRSSTSMTSGGGDQQGDGGESDLEQNIDSDDGDDLTSSLKDIFGNDDDDGDDGDDDSNDDNNDDDGDNDDDSDDDAGKGKKKGQSDEERVAAEIANMLKGIAIPEDVIPEDFNPSDPKQFRDVLGKIQQQTAQTSMAMTLRATQVAMQSLVKEMKTEIQSSLRDFGGENQRKQTLESLVPEAKDPALSGLVNTLFKESLKTSKNNPTKAAQAVRKALDAMGVKSRGGRQRDSDPSEAGFREGNSALDLYSPFPQKKQKKAS